MYKEFIGKEVKVLITTNGSMFFYLGVLKEIKENGNIILENAKPNFHMNNKADFHIVEINKDFIIALGIEE